MLTIKFLTMKKLFLMLAVATLIFGFSSCGNAEKDCKCYVDGELYDYDEDMTAEECREMEEDVWDDFEDDPEVSVNCYHG